MRISAHLFGTLLLVAAVAGCATKPEDDSCLDTGINFEMSKEPMPTQGKAKAVAAMDMALAELGFTQSHDVAHHFDPIAPTPAVKYLHIYDTGFTKFVNGAEVPSGPWVLSLSIFGACGDEAKSERKKYADSIKEKIMAALQPYATETIISTDATYIEVD